MENTSIGEIIICGAIIFLFAMFWFCGLSPLMQHEQFAKDAPKIIKEINVTNAYVSGLAFGYYLITDSNGDEYLATGSDNIHIHVGHIHNITYYCNENNNHVIISAVVISPKPVDRLKCVNVSGRCE